VPLGFFIIGTICNLAIFHQSTLEFLDNLAFENKKALEVSVFTQGLFIR
jgi:hypothetical protein